jgi:hypothetical protein
MKLSPQNCHDEQQHSPFLLSPTARRRLSHFASVVGRRRRFYCDDGSESPSSSAVPEDAVAAPVPAAAAAAATSPGTGPYVTGQGSYQFSVVLGRLQMPSTVEMQHGHGLAVDTAGRIYFTFVPAIQTGVGEAPQGSALARWAPDGTGEPEMLGPASLAAGRPHGLLHHVERDGTEVLYHINDGKGTDMPARILKTTLDGHIIWETSYTPWPGLPFLPTDATIVPADNAPNGGATETLFVSDGYGSHFVHGYRTSDGRYIKGSSFGGLGDGKTDEVASGTVVRFQTNHGIAWHARRRQLLHCDRVGHRLVFTDSNGAFLSTVPLNGGMSLPCSVDFSYDFSLYAVTSLGDASKDGNPCGTIGIFDGESDALLSTLDIDTIMGVDGFHHPHHARWLPNGDLVMCTWGTPRIALWRRLS